MAKILLLVSSETDDRTFSDAVAQETGLIVKQVETPKSAVEVLANEEVGVVFFKIKNQSEYEDQEAAIQETLGLFSQKMNPNRIHFLSSQEIDDAPFLIRSPLFGSLVSTRYESNKKAIGLHYGKLVRSTLDDSAFGLSKILSPQTKIQTVRLTSSTQKQDAVEAVKTFFLAAKFQGRMTAIIANAVDELLLNAIYDAPVDELGRQILSRTPRTQVISLKDKAQVEMNVAFDGQYAAVSVIDHFGSLDKARLVAHLTKNYSTEEYKVKTSVAGAGIGLFSVCRSGGSFFFVSEAGVKTEVTLLFKRTPTFKEFKSQFRFISTQFYF